MFASLSIEEILEIKSIPIEQQNHYIVSGDLNLETNFIFCFRGDGSVIIINLNMFEHNNPNKTQPNFNEFSIIDHGLTLKFGKYEASTDAILYELCPKYKIYMDNNTITD